MICDRCGSRVGYFTGSYFNTETICEQCDKREQAHPDFERAKATETAAVLTGDFNFPGIGLPPELREAK